MPIGAPVRPWHSCSRGHRGAAAAALVPILRPGWENPAWPYGASPGVSAPGLPTPSPSRERIACCRVAPDSRLWGSKIQFFSGAGNSETPLNMHFQGQGHKTHWCKFRPSRRINRWHFLFCFGKNVPPDLKNRCLFCT